MAVRREGCSENAPLRSWEGAGGGASVVSRIRFDNGMLQGPPHPRAPRSPRPPRGGWILLPSPLWGRGWRASGVIASRGGPGEGVSPIVNSYVGHHTRRQVQGAGKTLTRISHHAWTLFGRLPEGRGFSPAEIAAPTLCSPRPLAWAELGRPFGAKNRHCLLCASRVQPKMWDTLSPWGACSAAGGVAPGRAPLRLPPPPRLQR